MKVNSYPSNLKTSYETTNSRRKTAAQRPSFGMALNIAEGAGKFSKKQDIILKKLGEMFNISVKKSLLGAKTIVTATPLKKPKKLLAHFFNKVSIKIQNYKIVGYDYHSEPLFNTCAVFGENSQLNYLPTPIYESLSPKEIGRKVFDAAVATTSKLNKSFKKTCDY